MSFQSKRASGKTRAGSFRESTERVQSRWSKRTPRPYSHRSSASKLRQLHPGLGELLLRLLAFLLLLQLLLALLLHSLRESIHSLLCKVG